MDRFPAYVTLRQIQYFLAAADSLHFTRAAESLSVTQPTLSHQIAQLEAQLGSPLFDRIGKQVRLTEAGAMLKDYAGRAVRELEAGRLALSELEGMIRGELRIGVIQSFSRTLLPSILGGFITKYPGIRLKILELTGLEIEQQLAAGDLDLGIAFAPTALGGTEVEPVLEEQMVLVVGPDNEFARRKSVKLRELDGKSHGAAEQGLPDAAADRPLFRPGRRQAERGVRNQLAGSHARRHRRKQRLDHHLRARPAPGQRTLHRDSAARAGAGADLGAAMAEVEFPVDLGKDVRADDAGPVFEWGAGVGSSKDHRFADVQRTYILTKLQIFPARRPAREVVLNASSETCV